MKRLAIIISFAAIVLSSFGQGELDEQKKFFYRNERTYSFHLNTNGYGTNFRYAKVRSDQARKKTFYEVEVNYIKDIRERKVSNQYAATYRTFVYGKLHSFYNLKTGLGIQNEMFRKQDVGSVSIRYYYDIGAAMGVLKPIYYEIFKTTSTNENKVVIEKFSQNHVSRDQILGKAPFVRGLSELSVVPGVYGKFGVTFEYSKVHTSFHAIEVGINLEGYAKRIPIMYSDDKKNHNYLFPSLFLSYRFGKVIDAQFKRKQNKLDNMLVQ
ncbi:MAG: hypothetical protein MI922_09895 [Bacteroidales bacterium]|nr:hypothetical protein [Bacteroidales bacterium]